MRQRYRAEYQALSGLKSAAPRRLCVFACVLLSAFFICGFLPLSGAAAAQTLLSGAAAQPALSSQTGANAAKETRAGGQVKAAGESAAQAEAAEEEKSWFLSFLESKISAPNRRISLSHIHGVLSSQASIGLITIADRQGVWLKINNAALDWNRAALLRGRVSVNALSADSVEILRKPLPNPQNISVEAGGGFALPNLPVGIIIESLNIRKLLLGEDIIGQAAALSLGGRLRLQSGLLAADLSAKRLDGAGGDFKLNMCYDEKTQDLTLDSYFDEPQNGILANILALEGRPSLHFFAVGGGEGGAWAVKLRMEAAAKPIADGLLTVSPAGGAAAADGAAETAAAGAPQDRSRIFNFAAAGPISALLPPVYQPFFGAKTSLNLHGALKQSGGVRIDKFALSGGALSLRGAGETAADGFLRRLNIESAISASAGEAEADNPPAAKAAGGGAGAVILPIKGGQTSVDALQLNIAYPQAGGTWAGQLTAKNLRSAAGSVKNIAVSMGGAAENLDRAAERHISAILRGRLSDIRPNRAGNAASLPQMDMALDADWHSGQAVAIRNAAVAGGGVALSAQGAVKEREFSGNMRLISDNIAAFAKILGVNLAGGVNLAVDGKLGLGLFDINMQGGLRGLKSDNAAVNPLLAGDIAVSGGLARSNRGVAARQFRLANKQFQLAADGTILGDSADLDFSLNLADMRLLAPFIDKDFAAAGRAKNSGGALHIEGAARGHNRLIAVAAKAAVPEGVWNGRKLGNLQIALNAMLDNSSPVADYRRASVSGSGFIGSEPLHLQAALRQDDRILRLDNLDLSLGQTILQSRAQSREQADGRRFWDGILRLKTNNLTPLAALGFMEGKGKADIDINLKSAAGAAGLLAQNIAFRGAVDGLSLSLRQGEKPLLAVQSLRGQAQAFDIFGLPQIDGSLKGANINYAAYNLAEVNLDSRRQGQNSLIKAGLALANGASLRAEAELAPRAAEAEENGIAGAAQDSAAQIWQINLRELTLRGLPAADSAAALPSASAKAAVKAKGKQAKAELSAAARAKGKGGAAAAELWGFTAAQPAQFIFANGHLAQIDGLALNFSRGAKPSGSFKLDGAFAPEADFTASLDNLPLALADIIRPDLGLMGNLSGHAQMQGDFARPKLNFGMVLAGGSAAPLRQAGLEKLNLRARGRQENNKLNFEMLLTPEAQTDKARNLQMQAQGQIDIGAQKLHLTAGTQNLPLELLGQFIHNPLLEAQKLSGSLSAQARIEGSFANPRAQFTASAVKFSAAPLAASKIGPLAIEAAGQADKNALRLDKFSLSGGQNLHFSASGFLPYQGAGLSLQTAGRLPLALANGLLAAQGAALGGDLQLDAHIGGALSLPQMQGSFAVRQGKFLHAPLNLRLEPIVISGRLQGNQIIFDKAELRSYQGGAISLGGSLSLDKGAGFPAHLQIGIKQFAYNDGVSLATVLDGALTVQGALERGADIGGKIKIDKAEIRVPDKFGGAAMLAAENRHLTPQIAQTQKRAGLETGKPTKQEAAEKAQAAQFLPKLNIEISAPNQIFVRGRGLDAEMGGSLRLSGRADALVPSGGFNLIRGRFDILAQRLVFSRGQVRLAGDFNPHLDFAATSNGEDVVVTISVSGTPKDLKITLSSEPKLPQDEILARLIFKRSLGELSPLQVAQLVDAAAELTGITQTSMMSRLRTATGLDQLDVSTDAQGRASVAAGRYIMDNLYLGVETASGGEGKGSVNKGTVNLDITPHLKAKGAIGSDSSSDLGLFFERDY